MNDLLHEMTSTGPLVGAGATLLLVGALLWHLPRVYRGIFELRTTSAARLRAAGEEERAQRLDSETAALRRRVPVVGRVLVGVGVAVLVASMFTHS